MKQFEAKVKPYLLFSAYVGLFLILVDAIGVLGFIESVISKSGARLSIPSLPTLKVAAYCIAVGMVCK